VEIRTTSDKSKYAFLQLITRENYDAARLAIRQSGDVQITDLIKIGEAEASFEHFTEKRQKFLEQKNAFMDIDQQVAYVRHHVPDEARLKFFECVRGQNGIRVFFIQETEDAATVVVTYRAAPNSWTTYEMQIRGGTADPVFTKAPRSISHDGTESFVITRQKGQQDLRVVVNTKNSLSWSALSVRPSFVTPPPPPPPQKTDCTPRRLLPDRPQYFNATGRVRVEGAAISINADCSAVLSFQAAAMAVETIQGNDGPWLNLAWLGSSGFLTEYKEELIVNVVACGGYRNYSQQIKTLPDKSVVEKATGFSLNMPGGSAGQPCIR
jgi:hypothetical protein